MRTVWLPSHNCQITTDESQMLHYLSEAEEEADATTQLEGIVDCVLQLAHASRTLTPSFTVTTTTGSLQHGKFFSA
jgi:hypothetical protein